MQREYWCDIHKRAFKGARRALGIETWEHIVIAILLAITARALIWLVGDNEMAGHALIIRLCLMAAVIVIFPLVYCWKFVTAPAKVAAEANETITQYEQRCAILEIGNPYSVSNSSFGGIRWMIKIHNTGASADNVHMNLCDISPRPRSQFSESYRRGAH
jgi:hypothetical protein